MGQKNGVGEMGNAGDWDGVHPHLFDTKPVRQMLRCKSGLGFVHSDRG